MTKPATGGQAAAPDGPTATYSVPDGPTAPSGGQTTGAEGAHGPTESQSNWTISLSSQYAESGGLTRAPNDPTVAEGAQTVSPGDSTASSCKTGASNGTDETSSPTALEEDIDDDLLDYEPSPARNGMEISVVYLSSTDYSLLEEEEVSQLALGP
jgi:hypothetical protein